jgi:hypothetical protein
MFVDLLWKKNTILWLISSQMTDLKVSNTLDNFSGPGTRVLRDVSWWIRQNGFGVSLHKQEPAGGRHTAPHARRLGETGESAARRVQQGYLGYLHSSSSISILYTFRSSRFSPLYTLLPHSSSSISHTLYQLPTAAPLAILYKFYLNISIWDLVLKDLLKWI